MHQEEFVQAAKIGYDLLKVSEVHPSYSPTKVRTIKHFLCSAISKTAADNVGFLDVPSSVTNSEPAIRSLYFYTPNPWQWSCSKSVQLSHTKNALGQQQ